MAAGQDLPTLATSDPPAGDWRGRGGSQPGHVLQLAVLQSEVEIEGRQRGVSRHRTVHPVVELQLPDEPGIGL